MEALIIIAILIVLMLVVFTGGCAIAYLLHHGEDSDERRDYDED